MEPPLRGVLRLRNEDFSLPMSYLKVIRFEPGMCAVLFGGSSLKHETATMAATDPLERPSRTTGTAHSLSKGRLVSLKNSSQTQ